MNSEFNKIEQSLQKLKKSEFNNEKLNYVIDLLINENDLSKHFHEFVLSTNKALQAITQNILNSHNTFKELQEWTQNKNEENKLQNEQMSLISEGFEIQSETLERLSGSMNTLYDVLQQRIEIHEQRLDNIEK